MKMKYTRGNRRNGFRHFSQENNNNVLIGKIIQSRLNKLTL